MNVILTKHRAMLFTKWKRFDGNKLVHWSEKLNRNKQPYQQSNAGCKYFTNAF